jgi:hypothetical protein
MLSSFTDYPKHYKYFGLEL